MITVLIVFIIFWLLTTSSEVERYMDTCYTYAMRDLDPLRDTRKIPGGPGQGSSTCNQMIKDIQQDYPEKGVYPAQDCPPGYYKIAPYIDPSQDYFEFHFYREDSDGNWTHKMGIEGSPTHLDAGGQPITNPSLADRDYGNLNYTLECPTLCVKN